MRVRPERWIPWAVHSLVAIALTWPLVAQLDEIPLGTEPTPTVPWFNLGTLGWTADRAAHGFAGWWDAPIFHPEAGTFALSDPQPLTGIAFTVLHGLGFPAATSYDLLLLGFLVLNGWAATRLARHVRASWADDTRQATGLAEPTGADAQQEAQEAETARVSLVPAIAVGVLAQALPFVFNELGVLQLTVLFPMLLALTALHDWAETGRRRHAVLLGLWFGVTFLTSSYYALFLAVLLAALGWSAFDRHWDRNRLLDAGLAMAVAATLVLPIAIPQGDITSDYRRSDATIEANSAALRDHVVLDADAWGHVIAPWLRDDPISGQRLYAGTVLIGLAYAGFVLGRRGPDRRWVRFCLSGVLLTFMLSLGLRLDIAGWQPYELVRTLPGYENLRSPFRFAALTQILLLPLAAIALDRLWSSPNRWIRIAVPALVIVGIAEVAMAPGAMTPVPQSDEPWIEALAEQPDGAVAMLPFPDEGSAKAFAPTVGWMLDGLEHGHPLVNGYSGLFPASYDELADQVSSFPDETALDALTDSGVRWVAIDRSWPARPRQSELDAMSDRLVKVYADDDAVIYELLSTEPSR